MDDLQLPQTPASHGPVTLLLGLQFILLVFFVMLTVMKKEPEPEKPKTVLLEKVSALPEGAANSIDRGELHEGPTFNQLDFEKPKQDANANMLRVQIPLDAMFDGEAVMADKIGLIGNVLALAKADPAPPAVTVAVLDAPENFQQAATKVGVLENVIRPVGLPESILAVRTGSPSVVLEFRYALASTEAARLAKSLGQLGDVEGVSER